MEVINISSVVALVEKYGKEEAIKIIDDYLRSSGWATKIEKKYYKTWEEAKGLIQKGEFDKLPEVDKLLKDLISQADWD
jgi:hypothetical protein